MFLVDTGLGNPRICMQDELTGVKINRATRFENTVELLHLVARESLIKKQILERFFIDLVARESRIKERAAARFNSSDDAREVADYLWNNYLSGSADHRPLGDAVLDGVEFHIHHGNVTYLDDLALALAEYRNQSQQPIYLAAAPECPLPDPALDGVIQTRVINYVWVEFFDNPPCQYSPGNTTLLFYSWGSWSVYAGIYTLFLGIPISPDIAPAGGYIPPDVLAHQVLPYMKTAPNYGGLMIFPYLHHEVNFNSRLQSYAAAI